MSENRNYKLIFIALILALGVVAPAFPQANAALQGTATHVTYVGTTTPNQGTVGSDTGSETAGVFPDVSAPHATSSPGDTATTVPNPTPTPISTNTNNMIAGFNGISHRDQRLAANANGFSVEPPDQGLAVGNGFVVEAINLAVRIFDTTGTPLTVTMDLNGFFNTAPAICRNSLPPCSPAELGDRGPFLSDPKVYFDWQTNRFFLTTLSVEQNPETFSFRVNSTHVLIAVTQTGNPTGTWNIFDLHTTNDGSNGTPVHPLCPCFGDQPLIGADANGFYVSTNEFTLGGVFYAGPFAFNGAQVYAMSKADLAAGIAPTAVLFNTGAIPTPDVGGIWYSVQPATSPPGGSYAAGHRGTEYFLSALQFGPNPLDNRIAVWALTGTRSLTDPDPTPNVSLTVATISSETYGQPPDATQKAGPIGSRPLGEFLGQPLEFLAGNDDRMNQVVFADGLLWSGLNTAVQATDPFTVAIAYFIVSPFVNGHGVGGVVVSQGYIHPAGESVLFPSIGVNANGGAVMTFTLVGPDYFPSAAYAKISTDGVGKIHIAGAGAGPEDGFSGYGCCFGGAGGNTGITARWGDYTAASSDENGNIWISAEMIPGGARTVNANWGTFIAAISAED